MNNEPDDANARRAIRPVICYPTDRRILPDLTLYQLARRSAKKIENITVNPREASCFLVRAGQFFRITSVGGPQVGDLNLWSAKNWKEKFYSGKTRALHGTHLTTGQRMWSCFPFLRPMATIVVDTLAWYGVDEFGASVHDVIGTRCDPYTHNLLTGRDYHNCCHSNLCKAFAETTGVSKKKAESFVHDVLNVFMCTGFTQDTRQYFMKASPVRPGDYIEFFAEIDLLAGLSACPGGDCSSEHSSENSKCYPLRVDIFQADHRILRVGEADGWSSPQLNMYNEERGY